MTTDWNARNAGGPRLNWPTARAAPRSCRAIRPGRPQELEAIHMCSRLTANVGKPSPVATPSLAHVFPLRNTCASKMSVSCGMCACRVVSYLP